jgi:hypothetical protein
VTAAARLELRHAEPEPLLTTQEAAKMLRMHERTFRKLAFFKTRKVRTTDSTAPNASVRYRRSDVALYQSLRASGQLRRLR